MVTTYLPIAAFSQCLTSAGRPSPAPALRLTVNQASYTAPHRIRRLVIASSITSQSFVHGVEQGLHKVAEVLFGCLVGLIVSWLMSKVWLIKPPPLTSSSGLDA